MKKDELTRFFNDQLVIFDGAMGTELYRRHIFTNRSYDEVCVSDPALVESIHEAYLTAGADVLTTNTYGANEQSLSQHGLSPRMDEINAAGVRVACRARDSRDWGRQILIAGSVGPLRTKGTSSEERVEILRRQAESLLRAGVDFLMFETLPSREAALEARKAMSAFPEDTAFVLSHSMPDGASPEEDIVHRAVFAEDGLPQAFAVGFNCGLGPSAMLKIVEQAVKICDVPVIVQPNAGSPTSVDNRQLYLCDPEYMSTYAVRYAALGVRAIGGCCGTSPDHIRDLANTVKPLGRKRIEIKVAEEKEGVSLVPERPLAERSRLGAKLASGEWITTIEIQPPRSWNLESIIEKAKVCKEAGIDVINVPDGPRASPRLSPLVTCLKIQENAGIETVLHVCSRDMNFIGLQAQLLGCAAAGVNNILFITGDPPKLGNYSFASGVFDTDSIGLVTLQKHLNQGIDLGGQKIDPPTAAVMGVGADPNALDFDREIRRLREKVEAGANFVTTQPVFDVAALERFLDAISDLKVSVIAGIWPLASLRNALFMKNEVPGGVVPDWIIDRMKSFDTREEQLAIGIEIARDTLSKIRSRVSGVQVSAPLGNVKTALAVLA
jgi:homocysteine S-methyltransferase